MSPPRAGLTTGPISRAVLSLALPMMGSSTLQTIQSMVDMYFVGSLGHEAIAAVGMAGTALMVVIAIFSGIDVATAAMVARAIGAGDPLRASHVAGQSLLLTLALSVVGGAAGYGAALWIMQALGGAPDVALLGAGYLRISFAGLFFMCAMFVTNGALHGAGDAVTPLLLGVLTTLINCVLTPAMIKGWCGLPAMGVDGSSLSTVISRALALSVALWLLFRGKLRLRLRLDSFAPNGRAIWRLVSIGFPGSLQMSVRMLMNVAMMAIVAQFGSQIVAAYAVGVRMRMVGLMPLFCFGGAAATMMGQNLGAGSPARAQRSACVASAMALAVAGVMALLLTVFARPIMAFFTDEAAVIGAGAGMLRCDPGK